MARVSEFDLEGTNPLRGEDSEDYERREKLFEIAVLTAQAQQLDLIAQAARLPRRPDLELQAYEQKEAAIMSERRLLEYSVVPIQVSKAASLGGVIGHTISQKRLLTVSLTNGITFGTSLPPGFSTEVARTFITSVNPWIISGVAFALDIALAYYQWSKHRNNLRLMRDMLVSAARHGSCIAGATLGTLLGTMIFPGIGTVLGGIIGGICTPLLVSKCLSMLESKDSEWSNDRHYKVAPPLIVYHRSLDFFDIPRSDNPPRWLIEHKKSLKIMESHPDLVADLSPSRRLKLQNTFIQTLQAYEMIKEYLKNQGLWEKDYNSVELPHPVRTAPSQKSPVLSPRQSYNPAFRTPSRSRNNSASILTPHQELLEDLSEEPAFPSWEEKVSAPTTEELHALIRPSSPPRVQNEQLAQYFLDITCLDPSPSDTKATTLNLLGRGSNGMVYRAKFQGVDVAVRTFDVFPANLMKECHLMMSLNHPHIGRVYGMNVEFNCLVVELAELGSLSRIIHNTIDYPLTWMTRLQIAKDIATGLAYLHQQGIFHCDLKSSNILIRKDWSAFICQLSLFRSIDSSKTVDVLQNPSASAIDISTFGIILYELLTLSENIGQYSSNQFIHDVRSGVHSISLQDRQRCPTGYIELMNLCWSADPENRPSVFDVLQRIGWFLQHEECGMPSFSPSTKFSIQGSIGSKDAGEQSHLKEGKMDSNEQSNWRIKGSNELRNLSQSESAWSLRSSEEQFFLQSKACQLRRIPEAEFQAKHQNDVEIQKQRKILKYSDSLVYIFNTAALTTYCGYTASAKSILLGINPWIIAGSAIALEFAVSYYQFRKHRNKARLLREMIGAISRNGTCILGASLGAVLGSIIFPGIGTIIGSVLGCMITPVIINRVLFEIDKVSNKTWSTDKHYQTAPSRIVYLESLQFLDLPTTGFIDRNSIEYKKSIKLLDHHPDYYDGLSEKTRRIKMANFMKTLQAYAMIKEYLEFHGDWETNAEYDFSLGDPMEDIVLDPKEGNFKEVLQKLTIKLKMLEEQESFKILEHYLSNLSFKLLNLIWSYSKEEDRVGEEDELKVSGDENEGKQSEISSIRRIQAVQKRLAVLRSWQVVAEQRKMIEQYINEAASFDHQENFVNTTENGTCDPEKILKRQEQLLCHLENYLSRFRRSKTIIKQDKLIKEALKKLEVLTDGNEWFEDTTNDGHPDATTLLKRKVQFLKALDQYLKILEYQNEIRERMVKEALDVFQPYPKILSIILSLEVSPSISGSWMPGSRKPRGSSNSISSRRADSSEKKVVHNYKESLTTIHLNRSRAHSLLAPDNRPRAADIDSPDIPV